MTPASAPARTLGLLDVVSLGLNCVIGSGIFLSAGRISQTLGGWSALGFVLGGLCCLTIALCFAEMASRYSGTGGAYIYAREAFGPLPGFLVGWVMWLSGVIGGASVAVGLGDLVTELYLRDHPKASPSIALLTVVGLAALNYRGARSGAWSNNLLALIKMVPLAFFCLWALAAVPPGKLFYLSTAPATDPWLGFLLVLFTFTGFEEISLPAGEVRDSSRTVPLAILAVMAISTAMYAILAGAVTALGLAGSAAALQAASSGLPILGPAMLVAGLASLASINASIAFTCPRSLWALARDGWVPQVLTRLHPQHATPGPAILVSSGLTAVLVLSGSFQVLVRLSVLVALLQYIATIVALLWLRYRKRLPAAPFTIAGGPAIPALALGLCLFFIRNSQAEHLQGIALLLVLALILGLTRVSHASAASGTAEPQPGPEPQSEPPP